MTAWPPADPTDASTVADQRDELLAAVRDHAGQIAYQLARLQGGDYGQEQIETDRGEWTVKYEAGDLEYLRFDPKRGSEVYVISTKQPPEPGPLADALTDYDAFVDGFADYVDSLDGVLDDVSTDFPEVATTDGVVAQRDRVLNRIRDICDRIAGELLQIRHGDYSFFRQYCTDPVRYDPELLFFGRIRSYKGVDTLLEADQHISGPQEGYTLTVAGNGPLDVDEEISDHVRIRNEFISNEDVCKLFSRCRAVVLPYREASQSGIVPIAYSFRKPVIATAIGGLPEVVDNGSTGFLVEPEDPQALAEACTTLLGDADRAETMGENGFAFKESHMDWQQISQQLVTEGYR